MRKAKKKLLLNKSLLKLLKNKKYNTKKLKNQYENKFYQIDLIIVLKILNIGFILKLT